MKKVICTVALTLLLGIGINAIYSQPKPIVYSAMEMANLEALTDNENGEYIVRCFCKTSWFSKNVCTANASNNYCGGDPCKDHDDNCR